MKEIILAFMRRFLTPKGGTKHVVPSSEEETYESANHYDELMRSVELSGDEDNAHRQYRV